ncbi:MAG: aminoglycoside phosphotransferase family protein [Micromonosporaceae bacterium]
MYGYASLVLPVRREAEPAILKISWPHPEARHEHLALRAWDGHHAVRLLAADPSRWAMLLERLDWRRTLLSEPIDDACARIGELLGALDVPALPQLDTLSDFAEKFVEWLEGGTPTLPPRHEPPLPPRFLDQARGLLRDLTSSPDLDSRLVNTDLHYANVLYGRDGQWLAIDPKPMAADPAYAVAPAIRTRWHEVVDGSEPDPGEGAGEILVRDDVGTREVRRPQERPPTRSVARNRQVRTGSGYRYILRGRSVTSSACIPHCSISADSALMSRPARWSRRGRGSRAISSQIAAYWSAS